MKRSRFTEEQILFALKQAAAGQSVADVCRQMGISEATFYVWKKRYGNLGLLKVRELRQLRDENARLKRLVADLTLDRHILQEVVKKRSGHGQASRPRSMDTGLFPAQRPPVVLADPSQERDPVLPFASARQQRSATEAPGAGDGPTAFRLPALAHPARTGGLAGRPQPGASALQAGGTPGSHESASAQADQFAPRAGASGHERWPVLGHGFRP